MKREPSKIAAGWRDLFALLPGYDPIQTAEPGDWFDPEVAQASIDFFSERLKLTKDSTGARAGQPFHLEPWQAAVVATLFGWFRVNSKGEQVRRYREVFVAIPRKNGKSEFCAGIANLAAFEDDEFGAEVYCAAATRDQASLLFSAGKLMVEMDEELSNRATVYDRKVLIDATGVKFTAISADALKQHGLNPHVALVDELHAQPNGDLVEALQTGQAARRQPLLIYLTTSDYDRPGSICNETWDHAREIRDGRRRVSTFLPVIFEAIDDVDDWTDESTWRKANPNLEVSVSLDYLRDFVAKAEHLPRLRNSFKRLHLNIRTGQADEWLPMDRWDDCDGSAIEHIGALDWEDLEEYLEGKPCWLGVDLSQRYDMTAVVAVFREELDLETVYIARAWFWLPEETIRNPAREKKQRDLRQQWVDDGWLQTTPGEVVDYARIRVFIRDEIGTRFNVRGVGVDPWQAEKTAQELDEDRFEVVKFPQRFSHLTAPTQEFETAVVARRLVHGGHPILREQARVAAADESAEGHLKPSKKRSGDKVDGIVALVMGVGLAMTGDDSGDSVYDERGLRTIDLG